MRRRKLTGLKKTYRKSCALLLAALLPVLSAAALPGAHADEYVENQWNYADGTMDTSHGIPEDAIGVLGRIRRNGVLRVATEPDHRPYTFIDASGNLAGADIEMARLIAERMGVELKIVPMEAMEVLQAVSDDQCDIALSALAYSPARASSNELSMGYTFPNISTSTGVMIREADRDKILTIEDLEGKNLAAKSGSLQEVMIANNVESYREFRRVASVQNAYDLVARRKADAAAVDRASAEAYIRENPGCGLVLVEKIVLEADEHFLGYRAAAKKGEIQLMYFVNGVIDELLKSGQYEAWLTEYTKKPGKP